MTSTCRTNWFCERYPQNFQMGYFSTEVMKSSLAPLVADSSTAHPSPKHARCATALNGLNT